MKPLKLEPLFEVVTEYGNYVIVRTHFLIHFPIDSHHYQEYWDEYQKFEQQRNERRKRNYEETTEATKTTETADKTSD